MATPPPQPTDHADARGRRDDPVLTASSEQVGFEPRRARAATCLLLAGVPAAGLVWSLVAFTEVRDRVAAGEGSSPAVGWFFAVGGTVLAAYVGVLLVLGAVRSSRWRCGTTGEVLVARRRRHRGGEAEGRRLHEVYAGAEPARFPARPAWFRRGDVVVTTYVSRRRRLLLVSVVVRVGGERHGLPLVVREGKEATTYGDPPGTPGDVAVSPVSTV